MKRLQIALICLMALIISQPTIAQDTGISEAQRYAELNKPFWR